MSYFNDLKEKLIKADNEAVDEWNNAIYGFHLEDKLAFIEYRRNLVAGAVGLILTELARRDDLVSHK